MEENVDNLLSENLEIEVEVKEYLDQTSFWARYAGILGFCFVVLSVIKLVLGVYQVIAQLGYEYYFGTFVIISLAISLMFLFAYAAISNFTLKFGTIMPEALLQNDQGAFNLAWQNIKKAYRIIGALFIVYLAILVLVFLLGGLAFLF